VPALIDALKDEDAQESAARARGRFDAAAKGAVPPLLTGLKDE
jgi:hypothetical protein